MQWGVEGVERGLRKRAGGAPTVRGACAVNSRVPGFVLRVAGVEERRVGVSGVVGTHSGGVQVFLGTYHIVLELQSMDLSGAEQGVEPLTTNVSLMMWWFAWMREGLW